MKTLLFLLICCPSLLRGQTDTAAITLFDLDEYGYWPDGAILNFQYSTPDPQTFGVLLRPIP